MARAEQEKKEMKNRLLLRGETMDDIFLPLILAIHVVMYFRLFAQLCIGTVKSAFHLLLDGKC